MYGSYHRFMMESAADRKAAEEREAARRLHAAIFPPCPKCGRDTTRRAQSVNGKIAYYRCTRAACLGTLRVEV